MARKLRFTPEGGGLFEVTSRVIHSRLLLRPDGLLNEVIVGLLARAKRLEGFQVLSTAFSFLPSQASPVARHLFWLLLQRHRLTVNPEITDVFALPDENVLCHGLIAHVGEPEALRRFREFLEKDLELVDELLVLLGQHVGLLDLTGLPRLLDGASTASNS